MSHLLKNYPVTDTLSSVAITIDQCSFTDIYSSVNGGLISLTLNSASSSLSITNTAIVHTRASYNYGGAVYLIASKSFCDYKFTNVTFSNNSASYGKDVYIQADKLLDVVSASKFGINFTDYNPRNSLSGNDSSDYTTPTDLISLFTVSEHTIY